MFVPVINLYVSNLRSTKSRIIKVCFSYKVYQNIGNLLYFQILIRTKMPITILFVYELVL